MKNDLFFHIGNTNHHIIVNTLFAIFTVAAQIVSGQNVKFEHLTTANGLSQNSVVDIVQDDYGFIWMATQDGLNRYDGTNFKKYPIYFRDITRTSFTQLGNLSVHDDNLWMTNLSGEVEVLSISEETFHKIPGIKEASVIQTGEKSTWIGTYGYGLFEVAIDDSIKVINELLPQRQINDFTFHKNNLYVATDKGVWIIDENKNLINIKSLSHLSISKLAIQNEVLLAGTHGNGVFTYKENGVTKNISSIPLNSVIHDILTDKNENIWVATFGDGLYRMKNDFSTSHFLFEESDPHSINYNDVLSLLEDKEGNIWVGTDGGGVSVYRNKFQRISGISRRQVPSEFPVDVVRAIETDEKENIWIGTSGKGLSVYSKKSEFKSNFQSIEKGGILSSNRVVSLRRIGDDMWIGFQEGGLQKYNLENGNIETVDDLNFIETVWDIKIDGSSNIWLATRSSGLIQFNESTGSVAIINQKYLGDESFSNNVRSLLPAGENSIFFGTEDGHVYQLTSDFKLENILLDLNKELGPIKSLYLKNGKLWIGTQRAGIVVFELKSNEIIELNINNGLPNNTVYSIIPDNQGMIWISTNKGICQLNPSFIGTEISPVNQVLSESSGLVNEEFNTGASHKDENGILYFGGIDGINWFNPETMTLDQENANLILLELKVMNREGEEKQSLFNNNDIQLSPKEKHFQITFSDTGFPDDDRGFEYRLIGLTENWTFSDQATSAQFTNVPPGAYIFELRKAAQNGISSSKISTLKIHIAQPWWSTLFFRAAIVIFLIGFSYLTFRKRTEYIRQKEAQKYAVQKQLNDLELQVLRSQMNPHFMFNSLNTIKNYILKSKPNEAAEYLSNFSHLIRQILQNSREKTITLKEELDTLILYIDLEKLRFRNGFDFHLFVGDSVNLDNIQIPPLIIQPYIENAIWHGLLHKKDDRQLTLKIIRDNGSLSILIEDNGVGRKYAGEIKSKSATRYKSLGMGITRNRIELNNKLNEVGIELEVEDLYDRLQNPCGTRVRLELKIEKEEFSLN